MTKYLIKFKCSFDTAVSRLSIAGCHLEGFLDDVNNTQDSYEVFERLGKKDTSVPIIQIYRNNSLEFLSNGKYSGKRKKEILNALEGKFEIFKRPENKSK